MRDKASLLLAGLPACFLIAYAVAMVFAPGIFGAGGEPGNPTEARIGNEADKSVLAAVEIPSPPDGNDEDDDDDDDKPRYKEKRGKGGHRDG